MQNELAKGVRGERQTELVLDQPPLYQIVLHNDDFTPLEFVVHTLERFFYLAREQAAAIAWEAHQVGSAICGKGSRDLAETKIAAVRAYALLHEHPLTCSMEAA